MSRMFSAVFVIISIIFVGYTLYDTFSVFMLTEKVVLTPLDEVHSEEVLYPHIDDYEAN